MRGYTIPPSPPVCLIVASVRDFLSLPPTAFPSSFGPPALPGSRPCLYRDGSRGQRCTIPHAKARDGQTSGPDPSLCSGNRPTGIFQSAASVSSAPRGPDRFKSKPVLRKPPRRALSIGGLRFRANVPSAPRGPRGRAAAPPPSPRLTFRGAIPMTSFGSRDPVHGGRAGIDGRGRVGGTLSVPGRKSAVPFTGSGGAGHVAFLPPRPPNPTDWHRLCPVPPLLRHRPGPGKSECPSGPFSLPRSRPPPRVAPSLAPFAFGLHRRRTALPPALPSPVAASVVCGVASSATLSLRPPVAFAELLIGAGRVATPFSAATRLLLGEHYLVVQIQMSHPDGPEALERVATGGLHALPIVVEGPVRGDHHPPPGLARGQGPHEPAPAPPCSTFFDAALDPSQSGAAAAVARRGLEEATGSEQHDRLPPPDGRACGQQV
ncbi:hypothetical protein THAOC_31496 [Thalassiosira oceanica]|uniref:Uncharacterized protein n=1 Tax=Thalassiosira oceanica TaxID=159749 RepID=K0RL66_THAOC|nr:hypothetical protein THAOC_31496 [Thalassiosira oceanica]|eukprot:EJK49611.1 hypothetical protein THAOC_31496 [Thalassiosira oceanica]